MVTVDVRARCPDCGNTQYEVRRGRKKVTVECLNCGFKIKSPLKHSSRTWKVERRGRLERL